MTAKRAGRTAVTSADVARESGVSQSTVSYVMTGKRSISADTRRRVEEVMARLDYHPNSRARALAGQRSRVLGVVVPFRPQLDTAVILQFIGAIATAARAVDHDVLLVTDEEGPAGLRRLQGAAMCDAVLLMDVATEDPRLPLSRTMRMPVVLIGVPEDPEGLVCVDLDFERAGQLAMEELVVLGHRKIALITPSVSDPQRAANFTRRFRRGVVDVARTRGADVLVVPSDPDYQSAARAVREIYAQQPSTTAVLIHNSFVVEPVLAALEGDGYRPGLDVAVIAVCTDDVAEHQPVKLTSIALEPERTSALAVDLALRLLEGLPLPQGASPYLIEPRLVRRHSTFVAR